MKRSWLFTWMMALSAVVLTAPKAVRADGMDDVNEGMGILSSKMADIEKELGLKFKGDIRFRGENFLLDDDANGLGAKHRYRTRVRFRFGAEKKFGDEVKSYFRLATGGTEATSTNQTLTGDGMDKGIFLDQAAIEYSPAFAEGKLTLTGGKMSNPLDSTAITWDGDVNPEGAAIGINPDGNTEFNFLYFILQENSTAWEPYLVSAQLSRKFTMGDADCKFMVGGEVVPDVTTTKHAPWISYATAGMVMDATDPMGIPDIVMVEGKLDIKHKIGKVGVSWTFHAAYNTNSFEINPATVPAATEVASNNLAFLAKVGVGSDKPGEVKGGLEFAFIEPNAVYGIFSDSDSGAKGYNNNIWVKPSISFGVADGLTFGIAQYLDWRLNYDILGAQTHAPSLRTQIDAIAKL